MLFVTESLSRPRGIFISFFFLSKQQGVKTHTLRSGASGVKRRQRRGRDELLAPHWVGRYRREEDKSERGGSGLTHCWSFRPRRTLHQHSLEGEGKETKKKIRNHLRNRPKLRRGRDLEPSREGKKRVPTHLSFKSGARKPRRIPDLSLRGGAREEKNRRGNEDGRESKFEGGFTKREINQAISTLTDAPGCCRAAGQRGLASEPADSCRSLPWTGRTSEGVESEGAAAVANKKRKTKKETTLCET